MVGSAIATVPSWEKDPCPFTTDARDGTAVRSELAVWPVSIRCVYTYRATRRVVVHGPSALAALGWIAFTALILAGAFTRRTSRWRVAAEVLIIGGIGALVPVFGFVADLLAFAYEVRVRGRPLGPPMGMIVAMTLWLMGAEVLAVPLGVLAAAAMPEFRTRATRQRPAAA